MSEKKIGTGGSERRDGMNVSPPPPVNIVPSRAPAAPPPSKKG